jgi:hypothetical protein
MKRKTDISKLYKRKALEVQPARLMMTVREFLRSWLLSRHPQLLAADGVCDDIEYFSLVNQIADRNSENQ